MHLEVEAAILKCKAKINMLRNADDIVLLAEIEFSQKLSRTLKKFAHGSKHDQKEDSSVHENTNRTNKS